ncbi:hypothetical protein HIM_01683 [Hirsutella minnesotensis 3608]|nr:hypothetical protein HIM_01683 [Hirsutella minnesotensis 3608]
MASRAAHAAGVLSPSLFTHSRVPALTVRSRVLSLVASSQWNASHKRGRSTLRTARVSRAPVAAPKASRTASETLSLDRFPRDLFHSVLAMNNGFFNLMSADEYYECAERFCEAVRQGQSAWEVSFGQDDKCSPVVMHHIGCIAQLRDMGRPTFTLTSATWASASARGHDPSTISLARMLVQMGAYGLSRALKPSEARFKQLVAQGQEPNALTVEGELLAEKGQRQVAIAMLRRALKVGGRDFQWRPICELQLARQLAEVGQVDEARRLFESLGDEDIRMVHEELGKMLRPVDADAARQRFFTAGLLGSKEAFTYLSEMALEDAARAADATTSDEDYRWALEWSRLADSRVES